MDGVGSGPRAENAVLADAAASGKPTEKSREMMQTSYRTWHLGLLTAWLSVIPNTLWASPSHPQNFAERAMPADASDQVDPQRWQAVVARASDFLRLSAQAEDGSFSAEAGTGVTALVLTGLLRVGVPAEDPMITAATDYLLAHVRPSGGIYAEDSKHANYDTCLAIMALSQLNQSRLEPVLASAERYVKGLQWDESEGLTPEDLAYGGAGYGTHARPDLSNTSFLIEALSSLGRGPEDEAIQKALLFVTRCQNLVSAENDSPFAELVDDGGFYYSVAAGGSSQAGTTPEGGLRSYPSMTYAGLKSMIYAGVDPEDRRVQAAVTYLKEHYSVTTNPGLGSSGLFYYYQTMSKALSALEQPSLLDADGNPRRWRTDLFEQLVANQQPDGSWINHDPRWLEGDAILVTGYSLLALAQLQSAPSEAVVHPQD
jgi:squalene-hopene/tetraprenyl-beta-curcumene cyclase